MLTRRMSPLAAALGLWLVLTPILVVTGVTLRAVADEPPAETPAPEAPAPETPPVFADVIVGPMAGATSYSIDHTGTVATLLLESGVEFHLVAASRLDELEARIIDLGAKLDALEAGLANAPAPVEDADVVRINTATEEQLDTLPGVGPVLAARIRTYIQAAGPIESLDTLVQHVNGFGPAKAQQIAPYVDFSAE